MVFTSCVEMNGENYCRKRAELVTKEDRGLFKCPDLLNSTRNLSSGDLSEHHHIPISQQQHHPQYNYKQEQQQQQQLLRAIQNEIKERNINKISDEDDDDDDDDDNQGEIIAKNHLRRYHYEHHNSDDSSKDDSVTAELENEATSTDDSELGEIISTSPDTDEERQQVPNQTHSESPPPAITIQTSKIQTDESLTSTKTSTESNNWELRTAVDKKDNKNESQDLPQIDPQLLRFEDAIRNKQVIKLSSTPTLDRKRRPIRNPERHLKPVPTEYKSPKGELSPRIIQGDFQDEILVESVEGDTQQGLGIRRSAPPSKSCGVKRRKLVAIGSSNCGKTSLLTRLSGESSIQYNMPTVLDTKIAHLKVSGVELELILWDTAGHARYDTLRPIAYPNSDVILVCYSVDDISSLNDVTKRWMPELSHYCPDVPVLLVATKIDLREDRPAIEEMWTNNGRGPITAMEGAALATRIGAMEYAECSAKTGESLEEVFQAAGRTGLLSRRRIRSEKKNKECVLL